MTSISQLQRIKKIHVGRITQSTSLELIRKTFKFDLYNPIKVIVSIVFMTLFPLVYIFIGYSGPDPTSSIFAVLEIQAIMYFLIYSILMPLILLISVAAVIPKEFSRGTILVLDSYPLSRSMILLCKSIAAFIYCFLVMSTSLIVITIPVYFLYTFYDTFAFLVMNFLFSMVFLIFWTSIFMGFSALTKKPRRAIIGGFVLLMFFILFSFITNIPSLTMRSSDTDYYGDFFLYLIDLNYNGANTFMWFHNLFSLVSIKAGDLGTLTFPHMYKIEYGEDYFRYVRTDYIEPGFSLLILISVAIVVFLIGYLRFNKRDLL